MLCCVYGVRWHDGDVGAIWRLFVAEREACYLLFPYVCVALTLCHHCLDGEGMLCTQMKKEGRMVRM